MTPMPRIPPRIANAAWRVSAMLVLIGCSEDSPTSPPRENLSTRVVVSAPFAHSVSPLAAASGVAPSGAGFLAAAADSLVYVSVAPGTIPDCENATVLNLVRGQSLDVACADGGFDPQALAAKVGDTLEVKTRSRNGVTAVDFAVVPRRRPPVIVRTDPPKGKADVPLNTQILIVFSEPVDPATLAGAVRVLDGTTVVAGTVTLSASGIDATFAPASSLAPNTTYDLEVSAGVRSLSGASLDSPTRISFTTGNTEVQVVTVEPAAAEIAVGEGLGLRTTVTLADGGIISGLPVAWSSSNPGVASVDAGGVVRGVGAGKATITATVDHVSGTASISVVGTVNGLTMNVARAGHTATLLPDGRVLIYGGVAATVLPQAEVYDPPSHTFAAADDMITVRGGHTAAVLADAKLLFLDGVVLQDGRTFFAGTSFAEIYDPASATFTRLPAYAHTQVEGWTTTTLLLDGRVLLTGYQKNAGGELSGITELFDPTSGTFSLTGGMRAYSDTPGWGTLLADGTVLFVQWNFNFPPDDIELYDPVTGAFRLNGQLNNDYEYSRAVRLPDGRVLITGGQMPGGNGTSDVFLYLPASRSFAATTSMSIGRHLHTATLLRDGTVLITGGYSSWPVPTARAEIYTPPATP